MADTNTPLNPELAKTEIGASGTYLFYGYISGEEYNNELRGKKGLETLDIMRRSDPVIRAAIIAVKNPIIGAVWDIEEASDTPDDIERAGLVKQELFNRKINWTNVLRDALSIVEFGHHVAELVFNPTEYEGNPRMGIDKIAYRKQRSIMRWALSDNSPGITQVLPNGKMPEIPREKLLYVVNEQEGDNFEGIPLLRYAYKPWKIKDSLEIMNAIALERMSLGVPTVKKGVNGQTLDEVELAKVRDALRKLRNNEESYLEIPEGVEISILDMKANSTKDIAPTIAHLNKEILQSFLAQFIDLGSSSGSGSRAVSQDHSQLFAKSLEAIARTVQQAFQHDVVNRLIDMNYTKPSPSGYPKLVFKGINDDDVAQMSEAISKLMTAGAITADADLENDVRKRVNLRELSEERYKNYQAEQPKTDIEPDPNDPKEPQEDPTKEDPADGKKNASIIADVKKAQVQLINKILED